MRLPYLDTTSEEKELIRNICQAFTKEQVFASRTCGTYYFLRLYAKHMIHEDALVSCAIVLTICSDILDKHYALPYFDDIRL